MTLAPRKNRASRATKAQYTSIPAPIGGLNARDPISAMAPTDAVELDNWFPQANYVQRRGGAEDISGTVTSAESLMAYNGLTSNILIAAKINKMESIIGTSVSYGLPIADPRFQYINFSTSGGKFMYMVNGDQDAILFDGTNFTDINSGSTPAITGVSTSNLIHVNSFKRRLWFTEKESTKAWYLPVDSIAGAATSFDFGPLFRKGGYLMGIVTWVINDSNGTDEYLVAVSSEGECVVYRGTDPSLASTWFMIATFTMGKPIGRRFFCNWGSEVLLITTDGVVQLSKALVTNGAQVRSVISDKIRDLIIPDIAAYKSNWGWEITYYPLGQKIIVNVPKEENTRLYQYVMNTDTGAWCTFNKTEEGGANGNASPWNANTFVVFNDNLYMASCGAFPVDDNVYRADCPDIFGGVSDHGANIIATAKPAFNYFNAPGQQKYLTMARPTMQFDGILELGLAICRDFNDNNNYSYTSLSTGQGAGTFWDDSFWDVPYWADVNSVSSEWKTIAGIGFALTIKIRTDAEIDIRWISTDYVYQLGGVL